MSSQNNTKSPGGHFLTSVLRWFDSEANIETIEVTDQKKVDWLRIVPLLFLHLMCLGVFWVGWSWTAVVVAALLYFIRMFAITGFYHRYFSHKAFKTNRTWQFIFGAMGNGSKEARCGGPPIIVITTATRISNRMSTLPACMASGGAISAG